MVDPLNIVDLARMNYQVQLADAADRVRIQATLADRALQSIMLANGGALVALFTFVGNVGQKGGGGIAFDPAGLKAAFLCFAIGLFLGLLTHLAAFISQDRFYQASMSEAFRNQRIMSTGQQDTDQVAMIRFMNHGIFVYIAGLGLFVVGVGLFIAGSWFALSAVI